MQSQKSIAILVDWFLPGYKAGGPIRSCANIIAHLKNDFNFSVVTADCDANEITPYQGIKSNTWNIRPEGTNVFYFSKAFSKYKNLKELLLNGGFQVWYMNSLFSVFYTLFPLIIARFNNINAKLIVAPRGMLGDGALQIKPFKKKIFLLVSNTLGLYKNVVWHASTQLEKEEIQKHFGVNAIVEVALNLSAPSEIIFKERTKQEGKLKLVFFSRISIKKNLHLVFEFLKNINPAYKVDFDIFGLKEDESYWLRCENAVRHLPDNITAAYKGAIDNRQLKETLSQYHFSILPTMHENYGHSIVESWAAGCPVIISENTPWRNLEKEKCGWDILLNNSNKFTDALNTAASMNQQAFNEWSTACVEKAKQVMQNTEAVEANRKLFAT